MKKDERYFVFKEEDEKLHKIFTGDTDRGELKVYSKETPEGDIVYKIFLEPQNEKPRILKEGKTSREEFNRLIHYYENAMLKPVGNKWQEIKPTVINLDERDVSMMKRLARARGFAWSPIPEERGMRIGDSLNAQLGRPSESQT